MTTQTTTTISAPAIGRICTQSPASEVAVPVDATIVLDGDTHATADCANCPNGVGVTIDLDGEVFTWYHRATGRERCDAALTPLTFPAALDCCANVDGSHWNQCDCTCH